MTLMSSAWSEKPHRPRRNADGLQSPPPQLTNGTVATEASPKRSRGGHHGQSKALAPLTSMRRTAESSGTTTLKTHDNGQPLTINHRNMPMPGSLPMMSQSNSEVRRRRSQTGQQPTKFPGFSTSISKNDGSSDPWPALQHSNGESPARAQLEPAQQHSLSPSLPPQFPLDSKHTLLHPRLASLVSAVTNATRIAISLSHLFIESTLEIVAGSTASSWEVGRATVTAVWRQYDRLQGFVSSRLLFSYFERQWRAWIQWCADATHATASFAETYTRSWFRLSTQIVQLWFKTVEEFLRLIDALFGSTDTSRALAAFMHLARRELSEGNPEVTAMIRRKGWIRFSWSVVKSIVAWACLQLVTYYQPRKYKLTLVYTNRGRDAPYCPRLTTPPLPLASPGNAPDIGGAHGGGGGGRNSRQHLGPAQHASVRPRSATVQPYLGDDGGDTAAAAAVATEFLMSQLPPQQQQPHISSLELPDSKAYNYYSSPQVERAMTESRAHTMANDGGSGEGYAVVSSATHHRHSSSILSHQDLHQHQNRHPNSQSTSLQPDRTTGPGEFLVHPAPGWDASWHDRLTHSLSKLALREQQRSQDSHGGGDGDTGAGHTHARHASVTTKPPSIYSSYSVAASAPPSLTSSPTLAAYRAPAPTRLPSKGFDSLPLCPSSVVSQTPSECPQEEPPTLSSLLASIARFAAIAFSAYGSRFMQITGMKDNVIDAYALQEFLSNGRYDRHHQQRHHHPFYRHHRHCDYDRDCDEEGQYSEECETSDPSLGIFVNSPDEVTRPKRGLFPSLPHRPSRKSMTPRRNHERTASTADRGGDNPRSASRTPRSGHKRRYTRVLEHTNHTAFCNHTGIDIEDLLFSSYVAPVVPGVSKSANEAATIRSKSAFPNDPMYPSGLARSAENDTSSHPAITAAAAAVAASSQPSDPCDDDGNGNSGSGGGDGDDDSGGGGGQGSGKYDGWLTWCVEAVERYLPSGLGAWVLWPLRPFLPTQKQRKASSSPPEDPLPTNTGRGSTGMVGPSQPQQQSRDSFRDRVIMKANQSIFYRRPSIHALVHYIAVDHATESIVLACRGTLGISDVLIDMACNYDVIQLDRHPQSRVEQFRVHAGMWHSAQMLADPRSEVFREVAEALRMFPRYGLVLCGHSLGGGVASLLALLWSQPLEESKAHGEPTINHADLAETYCRNSPYFSQSVASDLGSRRSALSLAGSYSPRRFVTTPAFGLVANRPIRCYSYGSPCSTNLALSRYCRGLVVSVANSDDLFSFLSLGSFLDLLAVTSTLGQEKGVVSKILRRTLQKQRRKWKDRIRIMHFDLTSLLGITGDGDDSSEDSATDEGNDEHNDSSDLDGRLGINNLSEKIERQSARAKDTIKELDSWFLSLAKTLKANMDNDKLYPPGDVYILADKDGESAPPTLDSSSFDVGGPLEGADTTESANVKRARPSSNDAGGEDNGEENGEQLTQYFLYHCNDVEHRFSEVRFSRNMISHHLPSVYERRLAALVHTMIPK